ncbi:MAG: 3'-5' exonuclease [Candidatus Doudnabacteria bacterium]
MIDKQNLTIIDLETTGGSPVFSRVIEVGLLKVVAGKVSEQYQTLVNPQCDLPEFITKMTGITESHVMRAPTFAQIAEELWQKLEGSVFVAHNVGFDYGFLQTEFSRLGKEFKSDRLCTVRLSRQLYPEHKRHNLTSIIERFGFDVDNRHRAFDDASVLWDFLQLVQDEFDEDVLAKALKNSTIKLRNIKLPQRLEQNH